MQPAVSSIQKLLKQKLNIYSHVLTLKTDLKKDLGLADWEILYLLNSVEQTWQVSIPPKESERIISVAQLLDAVRKQQQIGA
jgi:acyl carrier protein